MHKSGMPSQDLGVVMDLHGKLARRGDDESSNGALVAAVRGRVPQERMVEGDQECGGLACAGLRLARYIMAGQRARQRLRLDWRALREPGIAYAMH
jgi:hypothetical protein